MLVMSHDVSRCVCGGWWSSALLVKLAVYTHSGDISTHLGDIHILI